MSICPITLEIIRDPVRTLAGIIYERHAIESWLRIHSFDPVTRLILPSNHLLPAGDVNQTPNEFRKELRWTICVPIYHVAIEMESKFVPGTVNTLAYSVARLLHLKNNPMLFYMNTPDSDAIDRELGLVRSPGTGSHFQCLDLSNEIITNTSFKCIDFRGTRFDRVVCMRVNFSRCNFSHSEIMKTAFVQCDFHGEQTIFVGARTSEKTKLIRCTVESHKSWNQAEDFVESMRARELQIERRMVSNEI